MNQPLPPPQPPEIKTLDQAREECNKVLKQLRSGLLSPQEAKAQLEAIRTCMEAIKQQLKEDPAMGAAKKEFAKGIARKAAETIDLDRAKEILLSRRFLALEDHIEAQAEDK